MVVIKHFVFIPWELYRQEESCSATEIGQPHMKKFSDLEYGLVIYSRSKE